MIKTIPSQVIGFICISLPDYYRYELNLKAWSIRLFLRTQTPGLAHVDSCFCVAPRAYARKWSGVEPGDFPVVQTEAQGFVSRFGLFYFPHEQHTRRAIGEYLSLCGL